MLKLSLYELGEEPLQRVGDVPTDREPWTGTELEFAAPPTVDLVLRKTGDGGVHVTGALRATVVVDCRRCLQPVRRDLEVSVDWLFEPDLDEDAENEGIFALEDEEEGELDLAPKIREELLLEVPAYPLCSEECQGLCPVCGTDQNEGSCECDTSEVDPRWGPLQDLASP
jgi:uncharacterized protein